MTPPALLAMAIVLVLPGPLLVWLLYRYEDEIAAALDWLADSIGAALSLLAHAVAMSFNWIRGRKG